MKEIVFATGNIHKLDEASQIVSLRAPSIRVLQYDGPSPDETGTTFLENARIKALAAKAATGKPAFADDSGICVDVMGGAPGIFSAGWSGTRSDEANRNLLLTQLAEIPVGHRQASFVCTVVYVDDDQEISFTGVWPGAISLKARGKGGFGYDPVFIPEGFEITAAELESSLKNSLSHRFLAISQLADFLSK